MKTRFTFLFTLFFSTTVFAQTDPNVPPPAARGIYAIWYEAQPQVLTLPYIKGGQIVLQWAVVEPEEGIFDFTVMDEKLKQFKAQGLMTTIQVNGNMKPKWLYKKVPHHPEKISHQIQDEEGSLMYWHPAFIKAYTDFIKAYAAHLKSSPNLSALAGVRMNFNALGTEHFPIPADKQSLDQWLVPPGIAQGTKWTDQTVKEYQDEIAELFITSFKGINLFMRNNLSEAMEAAHQQELLNGQLMLFHTSSEIEPRGEALEHNYNLFKKYARTGHTLAYAEPWASAWGYHGNQQDHRWTSPSQYIYWRLLFDLHNGVSLIAIYGGDLGVAYNGKFPKAGDVSQYQEPFNKAIKFAAMYAGYHASPQVAPGAWVAFRHNEKNRSYNTLKIFTDNYDFLMHQIGADNTKGQCVNEIGPEVQRFGAWAKVLPQGQKLQLQMSDLFASSLKGKPAVVRIIYYDDRGGSFETSFNGQKVKTYLTGTNQWKTIEFPVQSANFIKDAAGAHIIVTALTGDIALHMVNVERGNGLPDEVANVRAKRAGKTVSLSWKNPATPDLDHINIYQGSTLLASVNSVTESTEIKDVPSGSVLIKTVDEAGRESKGVSITL